MTPVTAERYLGVDGGHGWLFYDAEHGRWSLEHCTDGWWARDLLDGTSADSSPREVRQAARRSATGKDQPSRRHRPPGAATANTNASPAPSAGSGCRTPARYAYIRIYTHSCARMRRQLARKTHRHLAPVLCGITHAGNGQKGPAGL